MRIVAGQIGVDQMIADQRGFVRLRARRTKDIGGQRAQRVGCDTLRGLTHFQRSSFLRATG